MAYAPALFCHSDAESFIRRWLKYCRLEQCDTGEILFVVPFYQEYQTFAKVKGSVTSSGWGDAIIHILWYLYEATGNIAVLQENYESIKKWILFVNKEAAAGIPEKYHDADEDTIARQRHLWNTETAQRYLDVPVTLPIAEDDILDDRPAHYQQHQK